MQRLYELYDEWRTAPDQAAQRRVWDEMLGLYTDNVFSIGIVSGGLQPIVVSNRLKNVPEEGIWAFEPTLYFGHYLPRHLLLRAIGAGMGGTGR